MNRLPRHRQNFSLWMIQRFQSGLPKLGFIFFVLIALFTGIFMIPPTWDEYLDFSGCVGAFNYGVAVLLGNSIDLESITHDLEWYGNAFRWPAYLLWGLLSRFPVEIPEGPDSYDVFLSSLFPQAVHFVSVLYASLGLYLFWKLLEVVGVSRRTRWIGALIFATSPILISNSFWNLKEVPIGVAILFSLYVTILQSNATPGSRSRLVLFVANAASMGLILGNKFAYFPIVLILAMCFSTYSKSSNTFSERHLATKPYLLSLLTVKRWPWSWLSSLCGLLTIALLVAFVVTPQWWGLRTYPYDSIKFFANHPLVYVDYSLSLEFFLSRLSYLLTPPVLVILTLLLPSFILYKHKTKSLASSLSKPQALVLICAIAIAFFYILPILLLGRVMYGHDLRHLVWYYPLLLCCLIILLDSVIRIAPKSARKIIYGAVATSVVLYMIEFTAIYPYVNSYAGVLPVQRVKDFSATKERLIFSYYFPERTPEMLAPLLYKCSVDDRCVEQLRTYPAKDIKTSFPSNQPYLDAYVRLALQGKSPQYVIPPNMLLKEEENDRSCPGIRLEKRFPAKFTTSLSHC